MILQPLSLQGTRYRDFICQPAFTPAVCSLTMLSSLLVFIGPPSPLSLLGPQIHLAASVPYINPVLNGGSMLDSSAAKLHNALHE
ncbi:hypothetical protein BS47DRAFT_377312 [Hydnum rufescens UP504]|uniref:Uncharacterized protein n=1 Tax=Hydnum rufescens UP504 TaxID=1448309 RepID=A0A9P6B5K3_9AGAM|nr:hypothetical protein BS47DRAFT_377312 [Hydnum rufescens UP504]